MQIWKSQSNQAGVREEGGDGGGVILSAVECGCCTAGNTDVCLDIADGNCDAGGAGSSSCSITTDSGSSCSTTCQDSAESCCNDTSNDN